MAKTGGSKFRDELNLRVCPIGGFVMIIIRLEDDEDGRGPYNNYKLRTPRWRRAHCGEMHPSPWGDVDMEDYDDSVFGSLCDWYCGFSSWIQLFAWFDECELDMLQREGFKIAIRDVDDLSVRCGRHQALYKHKESLLVEYEDYETALSEKESRCGSTVYQEICQMVLESEVPDRGAVRGGRGPVLRPTGSDIPEGGGEEKLAIGGERLPAATVAWDSEQYSRFFASTYSKYSSGMDSRTTVGSKSFPLCTEPTGESSPGDSGCVDLPSIWSQPQDSLKNAVYTLRKKDGA
jgi:hypothetical protein